MMSKRQPQGYAFDGFVLDAAGRSLRRDGEPVALAPKAVEMLLVLVGRAGRPLSKEELMEQVWPDTFVEEANLAVHISMLRKTLGKRPEGGQYIETLPRHGYRFAAAVREIDDDIEPLRLPQTEAASPIPAPLTSLPQTAGASATQTFVSYFIKHKLLLMAALGVALLGVAVYVLLPRRAPARPGAGIQKLAVLPFLNKGPDSQ